MLAENLTVVAPELVLAVFAMLALMWGVFSRDRDGETSRAILWASCVLLAAAGLWVGFQPEGARTAFDGSFISDGFARFAKVMILFGATEDMTERERVALLVESISVLSTAASVCNAGASD